MTISKKRLDDLLFNYEIRDPVRLTDPDTSKKAAAEIAADPSTTTIMGRILSSLREDGPATIWMIDARTGLGDHRVGKRISDLKVKGLVRDSGRTEVGDAGKHCTVWEAVPVGLSLDIVTDPLSYLTT